MPVDALLIVSAFWVSIAATFGEIPPEVRPGNRDFRESNNEFCRSLCPAV
jgi:hypothetical protein